MSPIIEPSPDWSGTAVETTSKEEEAADSEIVGATEEEPIVSNKTTETTDALGNNLSTTKTNGRFSITTSNGYDSYGNFQTSATDELGNVTSYEYNETTGNLDSVTNAEGIKTSYTYNSAGNPTKMTVTGADGTTAGTINYSYDSSDRLTGVNANTDYTYTYNAFGTATGVKVGSTQLVQYNYSGIESGNYLDSITYGNGQTVSFAYDTDGNLITVKGNGGSYKYIYDEVGNLSAIIDYTNQTKTAYTYDADGNTTTTITNLNTGTVIHTYSSKDEQTSSTYENEEYYDDLDRLASSSVYSKTEDGTKTPVYSIKYGYTDRAGFLTSNQTSLMSITANNYSNTAIYEYDKIGNITKAGDITYEYDSLGQLVRVNDPRYGTTVYVYDVGGNIKYVKSYDYTIGELGAVKDTKTYTYGNTSWKDLLTSYNGNAITYDATGNPTNYLGNTLTWQMGRELASLTKDGITYNYKYNYDGLRTYKSDGTNTYNYIWQDGKLISQAGADNTIKFIYEGDTPKAINYNGTEYYYVTNLQGDIIAILDKNGNCVVEYTYDAWGKILSTSGSLANTLGQDNPLRYRGYYYDNETGLYYVSSRYYDPEIGRWISPEPNVYAGQFDEGAGLLGYNVYAYCANNVIVYKDVNGEGIVLACTLIVAGIGVIYGAYRAYKKVIHLVTDGNIGNMWFIMA